MKTSLVILFTFLLSKSALASDNWVSTNQQPVKDSYNNCIKNGFWTPATAHPACAPDLKPIPQVQVAQPVVPILPIPKPAEQPIQKSAPVVPSKVTFQAETLFDFDKSVIKPEGRARLDSFAKQLIGVKYELVIVIGHTDSIGTDRYNMRLGTRRAEAVKAYLISKGIAANQIQTISKGKREPIADNKTVQGRALNRRVVIEVNGLK